MESSFFRKRVIEPYFLERENPYSKRRPLNTKLIKGVAGVGSVSVVIAILFLGGGKAKVEPAPQLDYSVSHSTQVANAVPAGSVLASPENGFHAERYGGLAPRIGGIGGGGFGGQRSRNANQVIRRGESGTDPTGKLPMGYGISARLVSAVLSTNSATPVIAEVTQDALPPGSGSTVAIPVATRVIGNAVFDEASQRIQLRFHTLVYPEGDQHSIQGVGLMADGSAGIEGDYHSGAVKRLAGGFLGNFVGGMAEGMKGRNAGNQGGPTYEPGSIKNGILNGVSQSATDVTHSYTEDLKDTKATMSLAPGQDFIIFLEQAYMP